MSTKVVPQGCKQPSVPQTLLDRLGRSSNAYRAEDPFGDRESDVPVGFGSAEDQFPSDDAVMSLILDQQKG